MVVLWVLVVILSALVGSLFSTNWMLRDIIQGERLYLERLVYENRVRMQGLHGRVAVLEYCEGIWIPPNLD